MLAPRPTKLRSQRDINLWRIPLQLSLAAVALFGITLIPDILDKYGVIRIPWWMTMGSVDDARAILSATKGAVANRARADLLGRAPVASATLLFAAADGPDETLAGDDRHEANARDVV